MEVSRAVCSKCIYQERALVTTISTTKQTDNVINTVYKQEVVSTNLSYFSSK